jgi:phosphoadenosine phosphosulfate reductase
MGFQERILRWVEAHYGIEVLRIPHFSAGEMMRDGTWSEPDPRFTAISIGQISDYMREVSGQHWIATGERMTESVTRRGWITKWGTINDRTGRIYPVAHWRKTHILGYIKHHNLRLGEDYLRFGRQLNDLMPETLWLIAHHYPEDYERLKRVWPHADVGVAWWDMYGAEHKPQGSQSR